MKTIKFALVGCGRIGERHARHIANVGTLSAVCDINCDRAAKIANEYGSNAYESLDKLLEDCREVDVVSVCTPNGLHARQTIAAFQAGKHVLCEKPMALASNDCRNMIRASEQANRKLFIVKQNRFNPPIVALRNAIDEGRLGRVLGVQVNCFWNRNEAYYNSSDWKGTKELDGGTLYTQFSHFIDLMYWLNGEVERISAYTCNLNLGKIVEFEDSGVIALTFANGSLGTIHFSVNSFGKNMEGSITVFGTRGTVKVGGQYLNTLEYQAIEDYTIPDVEEHRPPNEYGFYQGSMSNHDKVYENIVHVLHENGRIATGGEEGLKTVEIIEKIYRAAGEKDFLHSTEETPVEPSRRLAN